MSVSALPTPPSRSDPTNFASRGDAFMAALPTFVTEVNALQADVNSKQTAAATSATNAATSATNAANSASAASTSATNAASSATAAANSATAAANTYDLFDDRFLGAKSADPSVDNDGNALQIGAAYFNTTTNTTRLWNGTTWQVAFGNLTGNFTVVRESYTATAGQTVFNLVNSYVVGTNSIMVYLNGVRLMPADYTETNGTTVTLASAAALNDELLFEIGVVSSGTTAVAGLTSFNPTGGISATNVQAALAELDSEKVSFSGNETLTNKTVNLTNNSFTVDGTNPVGFRNVPQVSQSVAYTCVLTDAGKHILHPSADTTARTFTIPANTSVAYPIGTAITFVNQNAAGVVTIGIDTDTMRLAGAGTTGNRTLAANGIATAMKITSTEWIISGSGLT